METLWLRNSKNFSWLTNRFRVLAGGELLYKYLHNYVTISYINDKSRKRQNPAEKF